MTVSVKVHHSLINERPEIAAIKNDLQRYLESRKRAVPHYFGRDARYERPDGARKAELRHIHLRMEPEDLQGERPLRAWDSSAPQHRRTSDKFLVYTRGERDRDCYIILAIVCPDAHRLTEQSAHMYALIALAEKAKACC